MTKEKFYLCVAAIIVLAAAVLGGSRFFSGDEDAWLCQGGQWEKHGNPSVAMPSGKCPGAITVETPPKNDAPAQVVADKLIRPEIEVDSPLLGAVIASPLVVKGKARGNWYFEASFPIKIFDENGNILAAIPAQAKSDWMTEDFVPFEAVLSFSSSGAKNGRLVLQNDNPSGDPAKDKFYEIPVVFSSAASTSASSSEMIVKIFLGSEKLNPGTEDCSKVFPVERIMPKTEGVARAALEQLLLGLNPLEASGGYSTFINPGVKINSLAIASGTATVDFDAEMGRAVGGSCRVAAIRSQITETLKQFPAVKNVVISVAGNVEEALQP